MSGSVASSLRPSLKPLKLFTKQIYLSGTSCPRLAWYMRQSTYNRPPVTPFLSFLASQGRAFEEYYVTPLRTLAATREVTSRDPAAACEETVQLMNDPQVTTILQPTFYKHPYLARGDVLMRESATRWRLEEVRNGESEELRRRL